MLASRMMAFMEKRHFKQTKNEKHPEVLLKSEAIQLPCKVRVQSAQETKQVKLNPSEQPLNWQSSILTGQK